MRTSELKPGTRVGSVQLVHAVDEGGMGVVWVAEHVASGTEMAVKFVLDEFAEAQAEAHARFQREMRLLESAKHPHVVHLFESGSLDDGTPYIVMEMLHGETLLERLERTEEPLSLKQLTTLLKQVCDALEHIHGMGIVHRDLKAENAFLIGQTDSMHVKLIDFGLAKVAERRDDDALTSVGMMVGSPEYMSPEQVLNAVEVDEHADLWAVAVLAYVALTLSFPFANESLAELVRVIGAGDYKPVTEHDEALPGALDGWFAKAFDLEIANRFASAREIFDAWERASGCRPRLPSLVAVDDDDDREHAPTQLYDRNRPTPAPDEDDGLTSLIHPVELVELNTRDRAESLRDLEGEAAAAAALIAARNPAGDVVLPPQRAHAPPQEPRPPSTEALDVDVPAAENRWRMGLIIGAAVVCMVMILTALGW